MAREITTHKVNGCNDGLKITAVDEPGSGGANHQYRCEFVPKLGPTDYECFAINFQNGPIASVGTNGLTHEALLAIVCDRLQGFQTGPYKCRENALAITKIEEAMHWLKSRTEARTARGVEGTHTV